MEETAESRKVQVEEYDDVDSVEVKPFNARGDVTP
jgi:hypothetical protein